MSFDLDAALAAFDPDLPLPRARTPPASWYHRPEVYARERETVFARNWIPVARAEEVAAPGSFTSGCFAGVPWVIARDEAGVLRAFRNTCRHRATTLVQGEGAASEFVCGYHGWRYALDGALKKAPELGKVEAFRREDQALLGLPVTTWMRWVMVAFADDPPPPPQEDLTQLDAELTSLRALAEDMQFVRRVRWPVACNWKVYVDNYMDGGYHIAHLHPGLAGGLELGSYTTEVFARHTVQRCGGTATVRVGDEALYAWIHPVWMVNRYGPWLDTNLVIPKGPEACEVVFDYYVDRADPAVTDAFLEASFAESDQIQVEDIEISERVQEGLASGNFDTGIYAVPREGGEHHFHRLVAEDLRGAPPR